MRPAPFLLAALLLAAPAWPNPVVRHERPRFSLTAPDRFERVPVEDARPDLLDVFRRPGELPGEAPMVLQLVHLDAVLPQRPLSPAERAELRRADAFEFVDRVEHDVALGFPVETLAGVASLPEGVAIVRWATAVPLDDDAVLLVTQAPAHRAREARALHRAALASVRGATSWETPGRRALNRAMRFALSATLVLSLAYALASRLRRSPLAPRTRAMVTGALATSWWALAAWLSVPWRPDEAWVAALCAAFAVTYSVLARAALRTGTPGAPA